MFYTDDFMYDVMGIQALPNVLYHYTSIETLALLLGNKTLRFSRLDGVNDPEEASASDLPNAAARLRLVLDCHTPNMQGVRIELTNNPFAGRHGPVIFEKGGAMQRIHGEIVIDRENGGSGIKSYFITGPNKIYYTDDPKYRNGPCLLEEGDRWTVQLYDIGMVKTYWSFEEEWRYKVLATFSEAILKGPDPTSHPALDLQRFPVVQKATGDVMDAPLCNQ
jgi:hypothetical protein